MAQARNTKAKPARKRKTVRRRAAAKAPDRNWHLGAGILALAIVLGTGAYMISMTDDTRMALANLTQRAEAPQANFANTTKQQSPELNTSAAPTSRENESAPTGN